MRRKKWRERERMRRREKRNPLPASGTGNTTELITFIEKEFSIYLYNCISR